MWSAAASSGGKPRSRKGFLLIAQLAPPQRLHEFLVPLLGEVDFFLRRLYPRLGLLVECMQHIDAIRKPGDVDDAVCLLAIIRISWTLRPMPVSHFPSRGCRPI